MSEFLRVLVVLVVAVNPFAVALAVRGAGDWPAVRRFAAAMAGGVAAWALLGVLAVSADSIIDSLDIEPETFRMAAGVVLLLAGARVFLLARREAVEPPGAAGLAALMAFPVLFTPEAAAAAVNYGVDAGAGKTVGAAAVAVALGVLAAVPRWRDEGGAAIAVRAGARLAAAVLMVMAVALLVDGVRDI
jgi:small neutral amino acid transporter SnatA (MarC family)